ncbi:MULTISPECIES: FAD-dependent monooxygenase [unclassified Chelatococcus]|uniref:FAD-dependent monooxygenase n=1 Tax=unclassified Chelatococcus TaxID=2638111 RepID=UPI001BCB6263|nr:MULTISPECIES: FAD-dependent monooxygenase [unclassified Chelatococcus]CAH1651584.1 2-polyprenyl-6-methoxyphenol hydroxylase-like FAD-dependent oxidoreductase [Hyphomicrobiales bacterium]MBS7739877.1 FAD-dependent monooxygenase [Chelatococcus sp. HY11]MBX3545521.1 FAD-dependent monooxygenase [Chelatococcus sp.]MCO5078824.1 FAD-dependent monooxygenase [Chelatococcus sp.]CAH1686236.1 2-polyprenyl-6-methoxyphenol hydroxylase-like FAD-dependent oxidoreductase [Hyphomicrobiales bacterium]
MALRSDGQGVPQPPATVLIVGSGPAGLFAASELLRHGVRPRIVEKRLAPHHETRGTVIQPAVLEILDRGGLIGPFLDAGTRIEHIQILGPGLRELARADLAGIGSKYAFQCSLPQWRTEAILREHLAREGITVEYGIDVESIDEQPTGVQVTLEIDGRTETLDAAYVLGAGGGHSVTRHAMGQQLVGETYDGRYIVADVALRLSTPPGHGRVIVGPDGFVLVSPLPDHRWLIFVNRDDDDLRDALPAEAELSALVNARIGADAGLHDLRWASYFRMHKRAVPSLGDGRRFLLGDAAHMSSPLGGEGINAAFMDAADIAWKLALVIQGAARPAILDSYAIERGMADQHVLDVSDEIHSFIMGLVAQCGTDPAPSLQPASPAEVLLTLRRRSMLDVCYAGSMLIAPQPANDATGTRLPTWHRLSGTRHHLIVFGDAPGREAFDARWQHTVSIVDGRSIGLEPTETGASNDGAILVRPDGFIGFRAPMLDDSAISALDAHLASYLLPQHSDAAEGVPAAVA